MLKFILIVFAAVSLAACATPAQVNAMIGTSMFELSEFSPLRRSVLVNHVSGGQKTNPLWRSEVGDPEFQQALQLSLAMQGITTAAGARYSLDAVLMEVRQPLLGFDLTVTSTVRYILTEAPTKRVVFDKTITAAYTATTDDAFNGVERLRLANEGSIRTNLSEFLDQLIDALGRGEKAIIARRAPKTAPVLLGRELFFKGKAGFCPRRA